VSIKLTAAFLTCSIALTACGGDDSDDATAEQTSPAAALAEIPRVKAGLDEAAAQVTEGDSDSAEETVAQTYVDHFEKVEAPLEKVDPALMHQLESDISGGLRTQIKNGGSASQVKKHVEDLKKQLDTAAEKLHRP
jgi:hypothetical protein